MAVDDELSQIGRRVREKREEAALTLQELARRSGVATSTIQKVETSQMIPSVAIVMKIARGLGCRASTLVDGSGDEDELSLVHLRADERHLVGRADKLTVERLSGDLFAPALEAWRVRLQPGVSSGAGSIRYEGEELVVCESGTVTFCVDEIDHRLRPGDTLHFKASLPHSWRNDGSAEARFVVTGTLPQKLRALIHDRVASAR